MHARAPASYQQAGGRAIVPPYNLLVEVFATGTNILIRKNHMIDLLIEHLIYCSVEHSCTLTCTLRSLKKEYING